MQPSHHLFLQVADGSATFALNSPEGVLNWNTAFRGPHLKSVAAVLQERTSAVVTLASSGIDRPSRLDGAR